MKRGLAMAAVCSAFVLSAAPAQAASATPVVNLEALLGGVLGLLSPPASAPETVAAPPARELHLVESTAYCLTGIMASGRPVYKGAAAMNGVPLGTQFKVVNGPRAGEIFTIEDRIGHSSEFDIAYPGDCDAAIQYGRRVVKITPVT